MAMGGLLISQKGNGNGQQRPRPCGLVLLLAFGVAMLAIMALHKLRERRISNLLQENSHHLISLQLLLQKQTEYTKQLKGKAEETKAKMNSLRKQKMELDHRLLEMLSTIDSLKDEQKTMESELVDKQNQIKLLRHSGNQNPQLPALIATLKQKEDEIQDLKHRLNSSLTTHHPANPPINITIMEPKTALTRAREDGGGADNSGFLLSFLNDGLDLKSKHCIHITSSSSLMCRFHHVLFLLAFAFSEELVSAKEKQAPTG